MRFTRVGIPANESKILSVRREGDSSIDVLKEQTRSRSKSRHLVKIGQIESGFRAAHKIDVSAVWRERESIESHHVRRQDLDGALGSHLAHPQTLFFPFL